MQRIEGVLNLRHIAGKNRSIVNGQDDFASVPAAMEKKYHAIACAVDCEVSFSDAMRKELHEYIIKHLDRNGAFDWYCTIVPCIGTEGWAEIEVRSQNTNWVHIRVYYRKGLTEIVNKLLEYTKDK